MNYYTQKIMELLKFENAKPEDAEFWVESTIETLHHVVNLLKNASTEEGLFKGMPLDHRIDAFLMATFAPHEFSEGIIYPMNGEEGYQIMLAFRSAMRIGEDYLHPKEKEIYEQLVEMLK